MVQQTRVASVASLVKKAVNRDVAAFEQLYSLFIDRIYKFFLYRVGDSHLAEDLTSTVFVKAWQSIDRYQERGAPFSAWLYKIARNSVVDHYRKDKENVSLDGQGMILPVGDDLSESVERRFTQKQIRTALGSLKKDQREVIILHFFDSLSYSEIAEVMDKREGAIRTIQYRALRSLRKVLARLEG